MSCSLGHLQKTHTKKTHTSAEKVVASGALWSRRRPTEASAKSSKGSQGHVPWRGGKPPGVRCWPVHSPLFQKAPENRAGIQAVSRKPGLARAQSAPNHPLANPCTHQGRVGLSPPAISPTLLNMVDLGEFFSLSGLPCLRGPLLIYTQRLSSSSSSSKDPQRMTFCYFPFVHSSALL